MFAKSFLCDLIILGTIQRMKISKVVLICVVVRKPNGDLLPQLNRFSAAHKRVRPTLYPKRLFYNNFMLLCTTASDIRTNKRSQALLNNYTLSINKIIYYIHL